MKKTPKQRKIQKETKKIQKERNEHEIRKKNFMNKWRKKQR